MLRPGRENLAPNKLRNRLKSNDCKNVNFQNILNQKAKSPREKGAIIFQSQL